MRLSGELQYLNLLAHVLLNGVEKSDRTGTGTKSVLGGQIRFDLQDGFPLLTTKKVYWGGVIHELLWFLSGSTNIKYLQDNNVHIWDAWADANGDLGPVYGAQWRNWLAHGHDGWYCIDQIAEAQRLIREDPDSRRIIVNAWNVSDLGDMALTPCHCLFQFYVANGKLSLHLYQRSADIFLGVPFNIASYALLMHMMARVTGLEVGEFVHSFGDLHLYLNHVEQAKLQLQRRPFPLPKLCELPEKDNVWDYQASDFILTNYQSHPAIKAPVAV